MELDAIDLPVAGRQRGVLQRDERLGEEADHALGRLPVDDLAERRDDPARDAGLFLRLADRGRLRALAGLEQPLRDRVGRATVVVAARVNDQVVPAPREAGAYRSEEHTS